MTSLAYCALTAVFVIGFIIGVTIVGPGLAHVFGRRQRGRR